MEVSKGGPGARGVSPTLVHVTLNTGDVFDHVQSRVLPETVKELRPWLDTLLLPGADSNPPPQPVPHFDPYSVEAIAPDQHSALFHLKHGNDMVISFGVAVQDGAESRALWENLHDLAQPGETILTDRTVAPPAPWCGVLCRPGFFAHPDVVTWAADFERCLGLTMVLRDSPDALSIQSGAGGGLIGWRGGGFEHRIVAAPSFEAKKDGF